MPAVHGRPLRQRDPMGGTLGTLGGYVTSTSTVRSSRSAPRSGRSSRCPGRSRRRRARGSLDFVATAPFGKRRIALEKLSAHLTDALAVRWRSSRSCSPSAPTPSATRPSATRSRPRRRPASRSGSASSGCSPAASPSRSHRSSAGPARRPSPARSCSVALERRAAGDPVAPARQSQPVRLDVRPYPARRHLRLARRWRSSASSGSSSWPSGSSVFARRDLGATAGSRRLACRRTSSACGVRSARAFGDQLPRALSWGIGIGDLVGPSWRSLGRARSPT